MINEEEFEEKLKTALTSELISYVASYRTFGINKKGSILCMIELDKRRQDGDNINYEEEIDLQVSIFKSIGKGFVVKTFDGVPIDDLVSNIRDLGIPCMIFNRESGLIHIGIANQIQQTKLSKLPGVKEILPDKKVLEHVTGTSVS